MLDEYRAVGKRIGLDLTRLGLPLSWEQSLEILLEQGFVPENRDIVKQARSCIGLSQYRIGCQYALAPETMDCSSFVKWLYAECGIWLPRLSIQQREYGRIIQGLDYLQPGDLIFKGRRSKRSFYLSHPNDDVGHVGIASGEGTVMHATNPRQGVVEIPTEAFVGTGSPFFRGVRRYLPDSIEHFVTLEIPPSHEIETVDDIKWLLLKLVGKSLQK